MKNVIALALLVASPVLALTTVFSVEPIDFVHSDSVHFAWEQFASVVDLITTADVFLGSQPDTGNWEVRILDENQSQQGWPATVSVGSVRACSFGHFVFPAAIAVRKGAKYFLEIKHSSGNLVTQVFWDPSPNAYQFGKLYLDGIEHAGALAARV